MIQFFSVTTLYCNGSNLTDNQFLYIDVGVLVPLCVFQSWTGAYHKLTPAMPQDSLFNPPVLLSVLGSAAIQCAFQLSMALTLRRQLGADDYIECVPADEDEEGQDPPCSLSTLLYLLTCLQYVSCCLAFSISKPFRKPVYTNPLYLVSVTAMAAYGIYLLFFLDEWSADTFALVELPESFRYRLAAVVAANSATTYIFEKVFIAWISEKYNSRKAAAAASRRADLLAAVLKDGTASKGASHLT